MIYGITLTLTERQTQTQTAIQTNTHARRCTGREIDIPSHAYTTDEERQTYSDAQLINSTQISKDINVIDRQSTRF